MITNTSSGSYEVFEIADIIKQETYGNVIIVIIQADKKTRKCKTHVIQNVLSFHLDNSIASLLRSKTKLYHFGK